MLKKKFFNCLYNIFLHFEFGAISSDIKNSRYDFTAFQEKKQLN